MSDQEVTGEKPYIIMRKDRILLRAPSPSSTWSVLSYNAVVEQHLAFGLGRIQKPVLRYLKSSIQEDYLA